jgi:hypothetical protein
MNTIENDSQGSKARSPVIDLDAEDISPAADTGETEPPKEEPVSSPPPERTPFWTRNRITAIGAILAALLGAWLYREFGADFWPPASVSALEQRLGTVEASNRTLNQQLTSLGGTIDALKAETAKLTSTTASKDQDLEARLADMDKAVSELRESITALGSGTTGNTADPAQLADLTQRIEKLEQAVAALREGGGTPPTTTTSGEDFSQLSQALADLKAKFAAGVPYEEELDRIAVYVPQNPDLADLQSSASSGIANAAALGSALEALVPSLSGPGASDANTADAGGFWAWVGTVVKIRDLNTLDWAELARSAAADAKAGDLKAAIARIEETGGDPPPKVAEWRDRARQRLKAEGALAQLTAAVAAIIAGKP